MIFISLGYEFFVDYKSFNEATEDCQSKGGKLALPTNEATNGIIVNLAILQYDLAIQNGSSPHWNAAVPIWINVQLDGDNQPTTTLMYTNWRSDNYAPNNPDDECVRVNTRGPAAYAWDDKTCTAKYSYVCEFTGKGKIQKRKRMFTNV